MDFNSINISEVPHVTNEPVVDTVLDLFLQEIDILLKTPAASVFGNRKLGNDVERLLWKTDSNADYMRVKLSEQIRQNCYSHEYFEWTVDVKLFVGTSKDIGLFDITIKDKFDKTTIATKKFQFR